MSEPIVVPDLAEDEQVVVDVLWAQLQAKAERNLLRASYYDGKRVISRLMTLVPPQYHRLGMVVGWSAKAVDLLARRCNVERFVWPNGNLDDIGAGVVWDTNQLNTEIDEALISSLIHGVSFLVTTRGDTSKGEPDSLIHVKDAMSATGIWNPRTRQLDNLLSITGRDGDGNPTSFALYLPNLTITAEKDSSGWSVDRQDHPWGVPAEPMVYKPRAGRPFGTARISRAVMSLHDAALRALVRMEAHMDVYSVPEFWLLGADESIFKNADGTQKASWQVVIGRIKGIPDDDDAANPRADVKRFEASSPEPHLAQLNALAKMFARETSLPDASVAITDLANPTAADAYDASQYDLIAEAEGATKTWGPALRRSFRTALAIANGLEEIPVEWTGGDGIDVDWRSPRFLSRAAEADAGMKIVTAFPWLADTEVGLELVGLDEQQIRRAMSEKRRATGRSVIDTLQAAADRVNADASRS